MQMFTFLGRRFSLFNMTEEKVDIDIIDTNYEQRSMSRREFPVNSHIGRIMKDIDVSKDKQDNKRAA